MKISPQQVRLLKRDSRNKLIVVKTKKSHLLVTLFLGRVVITVLRMYMKKNDYLYEDNFFKFMSWLNSATITLLLGGLISLLLIIYIHWILGAVFGVLTLIASAASYIVFKK